MHPNIAQAVAAERRADLRRDAAAHRRARDYSAVSASAETRQSGQPGAARNPARSLRRSRIHLVPSQRRQAAGGHTAGRGITDRSADKALVLPDGAADGAESADLCSAGR